MDLPLFSLLRLLNSELFYPKDKPKLKKSSESEFNKSIEKTSKNDELKKALEDQVFKSKVEEVTSIKQNLIKCSTGRIDGILL